MSKSLPYIEELNVLDEHVRIEAKQCTDKIDKSVLETIIESKGQGQHTYYIPTERLKELYGRKESMGVSSESKGVSLDKEILLPTEISERINARGIRNSLESTRQLIIDICKIQPVSIAELADILSVTEKYLRRIVPYLLKERLLFHTIPEMVNHPNQKYTVK